MTLIVSKHSATGYTWKWLWYLREWAKSQWAVITSFQVCLYKHRCSDPTTLPKREGQFLGQICGTCFEGTDYDKCTTYCRAFSLWDCTFIRILVRNKSQGLIWPPVEDRRQLLLLLLGHLINLFSLWFDIRYRWQGYNLTVKLFLLWLKVCHYSTGSSPGCFMTTFKDSFIGSRQDQINQITKVGFMFIGFTTPKEIRKACSLLLFFFLTKTHLNRFEY